MMAEGGPDDRMRNAPQKLLWVGDSISPWWNLNVITSESSSVGIRHIDQKNIVVTKRNK